jgi:hypothetical protein
MRHQKSPPFFSQQSGSMRLLHPQLSCVRR